MELTHVAGMEAIAKEDGESDEDHGVVKQVATQRWIFVLVS